MEIILMKKPVKWTVILTLCAFSWGAIHPITKELLNNGMNPILLSFLRYFITTIALIPSYLINRKKIHSPSMNEMLRLSISGIIGIAIFALLFDFGLRLTTPSSSSIIINSQPIFMTAFGIILLKENHGRLHFHGLILGSIGIILVVSRSSLSNIIGGASFITGNFLCIVASILISIFYVEMKGHVQKYGTIIPTFIATLSGTIALFCATLIGKSDFNYLTHMSMGIWFGIFHISFIATAFAATLYHKAIYVIGVGSASAFKFLTPLFGVFLSIFFLDDSLNFWIIFGITLVIVAIVLIHTTTSESDD